MKPVLVSELAHRLGLRFAGKGAIELSGAAPLDSAATADLAFVASPKLFGVAERSSAGCLIVPKSFPNAGDRTVLFADNPRAAFAAALDVLYPPPEVCAGVHQSAVIHASARVDESSEVGAGVVVGAEATIGPNCRIGSGCSIGSRVVLGSDCIIYPNVTIYPDVRIGNRCILHSGCVLGADGFGFELSGGHYHKFPQVGRVEIGNDVEIGANSCVDRAALGVTKIGDGTKLDNMVHIGHNCRIGDHVVIAAQTGLSGGVVVEDYAVIGGQVGIGDKAHIESRAVLGSGCGILTSKVIRTGQVVWGTPARPLKEHLRQLANLARLPELREEIRELRRRLNGLESR